MEIVEQGPVEVQVPFSLPGTDEAGAERAARRTLRTQIAKLERDLADAFASAFPYSIDDTPPAGSAPPRLLDLGELERVRDELAERLHRARTVISERADQHEANRVHLEQMLLEPAKHPFEVMPLRELGEPGCGVYQVRPRLGLIGMLRGWWQIKLSSGCPLAGGHGACRGPLRTEHAADSPH
jgi:hypothetical protein